MVTEVDRIVRLLEKTFDQQPWYGSSIMEILKTIKPEIAQQRVSDAHCISELISHMIAWRTFATHRLQGDTQFDVDDDINFIKDLGWQETIDQLKKSQEELLKAMKQFSPERLSELVPSSRFRYT